MLKTASYLLTHFGGFCLTDKQVKLGWTVSLDWLRSRGRRRVCKMCHIYILGTHALSPNGTHYHFNCSHKAKVNGIK